VRFKSVRFESSVPTVNLVPMLDVVTVILCFFVLTAMTLTSEANTVDVALPGKDQGENADQKDDELPTTLMVEANAEGKILVDGKPYTQEQLLEDVPVYLNNNPDSTVAVIPDADASYEQVIKLLVNLRRVGGDRVSLAVGGSQESEVAEEEETAEPLKD
jgi:biopolymer transport protein ExbD